VSAETSGKALVCLLGISVPVAILFDEIYLCVTFVLSPMLVAQHWAAADKEIVLRSNRLLFPFAMWGK
jgi:hypothetical protein